MALFAALVCAVATAGCASSGSSSDQGRGGQQSAVGSSSTTYDNITFDRPTAWREIPITFVTGSFTPTAYWTNQTTLAECRPHPENGGHTGCGPPITSVEKNGVLVIVIQLPGSASSFHSNTTIAGRPAAVTVSRCSAATPCYQGAVTTLDAVIRIPGTPSRNLISTLQLQGFFGRGSAEQAEQQMRQMLKTARAS